MDIQNNTPRIDNWAIEDDKETIEKIRLTMPDLAWISEEHLTRLLRMAYFDDLTGLANRVLFRERMEQAIARSKRSGSVGVLLFIDLDNFKFVNDNYGHLTGDHILKNVGHRLINSIRPNDTAARLGGDEFVISIFDLDPKVTSETLVGEKIAERILSHLSEPIGEEKIVVTASIGISIFNAYTESIDEVLKNADSAMYEAKKNVKRYTWGKDTN